ncbi:MAG: DEAD/DEAH box helicase [Planctomycetia bacterium]|nr:DEAD/DEAH box helicase [Planctomycetia bacterium]
MTFTELGLAQPLLRAVASAGYTTPTPIQLQAIPHMLAGRDVLGCAQTGTGKTAAFALPILHRLTHEGNPPRGGGRRIRTLVLSPTRELASQICESFQSYGRNTPLRFTVIFGGVGQRPQEQALRHGVDVVVATPGRLLDLMNQGFVDLRSVEIFVLDEADRMLDMGFLPDLRRVIAALPRARQTLFFSATMPEAIMQLANSILRDPVRIHVAPVKVTTDLIAQSVCFVPKQQKPRLLTHMLRKHAATRALVFTRTKRGADRVARHLNVSGIKAQAIHGNKSQSARQRAMAGFKSTRPPVLVATDLAARGIDVENISHVFNYDLPQEAETYVHRIGRTGRAGATGIAVSFCDHDERAYLKSIERLIRRSLSVDPDYAAGSASPQPATPRETADHARPRATQSRPGRGRRNGARNGKPAAGGRAVGSAQPSRRKKRRALAAGHR